MFEQRAELVVPTKSAAAIVAEFGGARQWIGPDLGEEKNLGLLRLARQTDVETCGFRRVEAIMKLAGYNVDWRLVQSVMPKDIAESGPRGGILAVNLMKENHSIIALRVMLEADGQLNFYCHDPMEEKGIRVVSGASFVGQADNFPEAVTVYGVKLVGSPQRPPTPDQRIKFGPPL